MIEGLLSFSSTSLFTVFLVFKHLLAAAAAAAKLLHLCPTLCDPMDSRPPGSFVHRIL